MSTVNDIFTKAVADHGPNVAVREGDRALTFDELGRAVDDCISLLVEAGVQPGERVLDLQTNSIDMMVTDLAIRCGGFVRVALNYRLAEADWSRIATDAKASALIFDPALVAGKSGWIDGGLIRIPVGDLHAAGERHTPSPARVTPDTICGLHYSSGTTGAPKGAIRTHGNWAASVENMKSGVLPGPLAPTDVYLHAGPMTHTSGLFILPFLEAGASQVIMHKWDPAEAMRLIQRWDVSHTAMVPTMIHRLAAVPGVGDVTRGRLKMLGYAGAPMPPTAVERAYTTLTHNLVQYYGLVEATPPVASLGVKEHGAAFDPDVTVEERRRILGSIGVPVPGIEVQLWDDQGRPQEVGLMGELMTKGPHLMQGYWGAAGSRPDVTKTFRDGWLATGDMAVQHSDGLISLVDRRGDMIISGGYNIYPTEIENVLAAASGVADCSVVGITDEEWGQRVVAFVRPVPGAEVDVETVLAQCGQSLASYKKPKEVIVLDELPVNANGKVSKVLLKRNYERLAGLHV